MLIEWPGVMTGSTAPATSLFLSSAGLGSWQSTWSSSPAGMAPVPPAQSEGAEQVSAHRQGTGGPAQRAPDATDGNEPKHGSYTEQRADDRRERPGGDGQGQQRQTRRHHHEVMAGRMVPNRVDTHQVVRVGGGSGHGWHATEGG